VWQTRGADPFPPGAPAPVAEPAATTLLEDLRAKLEHLRGELHHLQQLVGTLDEKPEKGETR
jgi:hypothetical protein